MNDNLTNKTSANAVANGFEFEFAAALLIYLEHLKEAKLIGTEKKDDIYLVLKNGDKVYGQAKSSLEADAIANTHFPEIIDSLRTLAKNNDDAKKLISIFNFYRPFGDRDSFAHESNYDIKSYNELTTETKKKLKESIKGKYDIDFDKLEFWFFRFEGQNALTSLKSYIREKLSDIDSIGHFNIDNLISCWILLIMENARNKKMMISSDVMVGNLFSKIIESSSGFESIIKFAGFENDIGFVDEELLKEKFDNFIELSSLHFMLYNKTRTSFIEFRNANKTLNKNDARIAFINSFSENEEIKTAVKPVFSGYEREGDLSNYMAKIFVAFACVKYEVISKVSEVFGYEN